MTAEQFHEVANQYITKLNDIAKKEWLSCFIWIVTINWELNHRILHSIDWRNMNENEVIKSLALLTQSVMDNYTIDWSIWSLV